MRKRKRVCQEEMTVHQSPDTRIGNDFPVVADENPDAIKPQIHGSRIISPHDDHLEKRYDG